MVTKQEIKGVARWGMHGHRADEKQAGYILKVKIAGLDVALKTNNNKKARIELMTVMLKSQHLGGDG